MYLTDKLSTLFGNISVEYLDINALRERYKKKGQKLQILSIRPMTNDGTTLRISIGDYWFSVAKKSYVYEQEGGCIVEFKIDPAIDSFVIAKVDLWGV
jgi:hypothetical protein